MSVDEFSRIVLQAAPLVDELFLHLMGEPLTHPELERILGVCAAHELPVNLVTNGMLLDDARRKLVLSPIVRQVNISLHSFVANFGEHDAEAYMARIFAFTREAEASRPDLYVNLRTWDLSDETSLASGSSKAVRELLVDEFKVNFDEIDIDVRRCKHIKLRGRLYFQFDTRFVWPSLDLVEGDDQGFCHGLSGHFGVLVDGSVVPCCLDKDAVIRLGNCLETPLMEILDSTRAVSMREGFSRGELVERLCRCCPFIRRFKRAQASSHRHKIFRG